jgi:mannose-6-phosphate isomerase-like protein (cupin superfamily)
VQGWRIAGDGLVVLVSIQGDQNVRNAAQVAPRVVRAAEGQHLRWAKGAMGATLMARADTSPMAYVGWLDGTLPVPLHSHPSSCEVIVAVDAEGTFRLAGASARLEPGGIVSIQAGAPHAWQPDPGTALRALQIYTPPGPEQRFIERAAKGD